MKIIHHNDADGRLGARVIMDFVAYDFQREDLYERDYATEIPVDKIEPNEVVFIVDYSFKENTKEQLINLLKVTPNVYWIDHHSSSVELEKKYPMFSYIRGIRRERLNPEDIEKSSGCYLAYYYMSLLQSIAEVEMNDEFFKTFRSEDLVSKGLKLGKEFEFKRIQVPAIIWAVSVYDTYSTESPEWNYAKTASFYFNSSDQDPFGELWDQSYDYWIEQGKVISSVLSKENKKFLLAYGWVGEITIPNHTFKCLFINKRSNSYIFDSVDEEAKKVYASYNRWNYFDLCCVYGDDGRGFFTTTFFGPDGTTKAKDCATFFGGGGHDGAAGCIIPLKEFYDHIEFKRKYRDELERFD